MNLGSVATQNIQQTVAEEVAKQCQKDTLLIAALREENNLFQKEREKLQQANAELVHRINTLNKSHVLEIDQQRLNGMKMASELMETTGKALREMQEAKELQQKEIDAVKEREKDLLNQLLKEVNSRAELQKERDNLLVWKGLFQSFAKEPFRQAKVIMGEEERKPHDG